MRLRETRHVYRLDDSGSPNVALYGELKCAKRRLDGLDQERGETDVDACKQLGTAGSGPFLHDGERFILVAIEPGQLTASFRSGDMAITRFPPSALDESSSRDSRRR